MAADKNRLNPNLISKFRAFVNETDYILNIYRDVGGKNKWNIICSAMDWIDVSIGGIKKDKLSRQNGHEASREMILFLSCADVLWESIQQLHRVIFDTKDIPFDDESTIFSQKLAPTTDNKYFKIIRACFAAHPVNLSDYFLNIKEKERRHASWSGGYFGNNDFSVILYSNEVDKSDIYLDISFDEIMEFITKRYEYLRILSDEMKRQVSIHKKKQRNQPIKKSSDPLEQIDILLLEINNRPSDEYSYELEKLKLIFGTNISNEKNARYVKQYQNIALKVIDEIYKNMQTMKFKDVSSLKEIDIKLPYNYWRSKLSDSVFRGYSPFGSNLVTNVIKEYEEELDGIIDFANVWDNVELYVLIKVGLLMKNRPELFVGCD